MCAGGVLAYLVLIPLIKFFGDGADRRRSRPGTMPISEMGPDDDPRRLRALHRRRRGGGGRHHQPVPLAADDLARHQGRPRATSRRRKAATAGAATPRTDRDLSMKFVLIGIIALIVVDRARSALRRLHMEPRSAPLLIIVFGFLFVTVSSRLTGEIGSSSNPISGMTVATLLLTCLDLPGPRLDRAATTTSPRSRSAPSSASPRRTAARPRRT